MPKTYRIELFGKKDCEKCDALKKRIHSLLEKEETYRKTFAYHYHDLGTLEGLMAFARAETVNGQRIPAIQITRYDSHRKKYRKIPDPRKEGIQENRLFVPVYLQLETDYSDQNRAVIKPRQIKALLDLARQA
jgi:hypothetical protein